MITAVAILNWNGINHLKTFLPSVIKNSKGEGVKIVLIDNGSTDDSCKYVSSTYPEVQIVKNSSNLGYAGGYKSKVTYEEVCQGNTGHAEIVKLSFDENIISYEKILELFFKLHDPTQKDMQFPDVGTQYRSEIFYENEQQKEIASKVKEKFNKVFNNKIETNISPKFELIQPAVV